MFYYINYGAYKMNNSNTTLRGQARTLVTNKVLKNTYILLSMTLLFSAFAALTSYMLNISVVNPFITLGTFSLSTYFLNPGLLTLVIFFIAGKLNLSYFRAILIIP